MKFYKNQFSNLLELTKKSQIKAILLYGPDKGEISNIINIISNQLKIPINQVEYKDVNNASLYNVANSSSLFSSKELIKIQNVTNSISEDAIKVLIGDLQNFLIFIADELPPSSSIRKTFESAKDLAAIACYINDLKESMIIAKNEFTKHKKIIGNNALKIFCQRVGGATDVIKSEAQKLSNYVNTEIITEDNVIIITSQEEQINPDLMCYSYMVGNKKIYFQEIETLLNNSIEPVWIIRALIRYLLNILKIKKSKLEINIAIKNLNPPIFFKHVDYFKEAVAQVDIHFIIDKLEKLAEAEINLKKGINASSILDQLLIK